MLAIVCLSVYIMHVEEDYYRSCLSKVTYDIVCQLLNTVYTVCDCQPFVAQQISRVSETKRTETAAGCRRTDTVF